MSFDPYWQANWGEQPIHYVPDIESLQSILGDVLFDPHPTLTPYQDTFGRLIVPVSQHNSNS